LRIHAPFTAGEDLWLSIVISIGAGLLAAALSLFLKPQIKAMIDETPEEGDEPVKAEEVAVAGEETVQKKGVLGWLQRQLDTDVDKLVMDDPRTNAIHGQAEKFPAKTEVVFKYMQVLTASCDSFSHGANDVANAMGPFAAVWFIWVNNGRFSAKNEVGTDIYWILALGGAGIVIGLGTYGYKMCAPDQSTPFALDSCAPEPPPPARALIQADLIHPPHPTLPQTNSRPRLPARAHARAACLLSVSSWRR
jgi:phosphate/sulfate permease